MVPAAAIVRGHSTHTLLSSSRVSHRCPILSLLTLPLSILLVHAECDVSRAGEPGWLPGFGLPGVDGPVSDFEVWNGDLVIAGSFLAVGDKPIRAIGRWTGSDWETLGEIGSGSVVDMVIWNGDLIATGSFTLPDDPATLHLARFDGTHWQRIGDELSDAGNALAVFEEDLVVGGEFHIAGVGARNIARWDGTSWSALGDGFDRRVNALTVHGEQLVAGGWFEESGEADVARIGVWNGSSWEQPGDGFNDEVLALASLNGELYAGGEFIQSGSASVRRVARWNGAAWVALGEGLNGDVFALSSWDDRLVASGRFTEAGEAAALSIASWDGSNWDSFGTGLATGCGSIIEFEDHLYAGGPFLASGNRALAGLARWEEDEWREVVSGNGIVGDVYCFTSHEGKLIAGGRFRSAGRVVADRVAAWDGDQWESLNGLPGTDNTWSPVRALASYRGQLIAGGFFTDGGLGAQGIYAWDGEGWTPFAGGIDGSVNALLVRGEDLIVGGDFEEPGCSLVRWDGEQWHSYPQFETCPFWSPEIRSLLEYDGELIAAGVFLDALDYAGIARFDGLSWLPLGRGIGGSVWSLAAYQGELYAGGHFVFADGIPARHAARWNGTRWNWLDHGVTEAPGVTVVRAVMADEGGLVVGGAFRRVGSTEARDIALWDGSAWHSWPGGDLRSVSNELGVMALTKYEGRLVAGGSFYQSGGIASSGIAFYDSGGADPNGPSMSSGPALCLLSANPARSAVEVSLRLENPGEIEFSLHDAGGRVIRSFRETVSTPGSRSWNWDLRDENGREVPAGIYFLRVRSTSTDGLVHESARVTVIR